MIRISGEIIGDAYEDSTDVFDLLDDAEVSYLRSPIITFGKILIRSILYW